MSESSTFLKFVVLIGLMMVLVASIYPGANSAWTGFMQTVTAGPRIPAAPTSPLFATSQVLTILPQANGSFPPNGAVGCSLSSYYQCLQVQPDITNVQKYVWIDGNTKVNFSLKAGQPTGYPLNAYVVDLSIKMACKQTPASAVGIYQSWNATFTNGVIAWSGPNCPNQWAFAYSNFTGNTGYTLGTFVNAFHWLIFEGSTFNLSVAFFSITLGLSVQRSCAGLTIGDFYSCTLGNVANAVLSGFIQLGAFIVFGFTLIGGIIVFLWSLFTGVLFGFTVSLSYFFNLPGAPSWVQGIIDAILIAGILVVFLMIAGYAVGLFGGAVNKT